QRRARLAPVDMIIDFKAAARHVIAYRDRETSATACVTCPPRSSEGSPGAGPASTLGGSVSARADTARSGSGVTDRRSGRRFRRRALLEDRDPRWIFAGYAPPTS